MRVFEIGVVVSRYIMVPKERHRLAIDSAYTTLKFSYMGFASSVFIIPACFGLVLCYARNTDLQSSKHVKKTCRKFLIS